jgi:hypothetical protein
MPRISSKQKLLNEVIAELTNARNLIDGRTWWAFYRKLTQSARIDTIKKIRAKIAEKIKPKPPKKLAPTIKGLIKLMKLNFFLNFYLKWIMSIH